MFAAGADIAAPGPGSFTPLHFAALHTPVEVIRVLIERGADPNALAWNGFTPLLLAALGNDVPAVLEALLAAGAKRDVRTEGGRTRLHLAAQAGQSNAPPKHAHQKRPSCIVAR